MYYIKDAKIRRMTEHNGAPCAEVGVLPGSLGDTALLVYVTEGQDGDYDMVKIIRNEADTVLDWYDNGMHAAFVDVTNGAFEATDMMTAEQERHKFKRELLSFGNIEADLKARFSE
ncbi:hypothetical protein [Paenibacillus pini]|uniref:Uncharacterized protein n=1 Tax=Paenibacillus pini JCM 16418 TaxID=1236976 RepID=W7YRB7_9BACL|nr:hypothetical protein [Paenibacillus pini]GAF09988.1 hypothetical protein JCM16418_4156 [Paenibacillus pini JCM 16418]